MSPPPAVQTDIRPARPDRLETESLQKTYEPDVAANRIEPRVAGYVDERRIALLARRIEEAERLLGNP